MGRTGGEVLGYLGAQKADEGRPHAQVTVRYDTKADKMERLPCVG